MAEKPQSHIEGGNEPSKQIEFGRHNSQLLDLTDNLSEIEKDRKALLDACKGTAFEKSIGKTEDIKRAYLISDAFGGNNRFEVKVLVDDGKIISARVVFTSDVPHQENIYVGGQPGWKPLDETEAMISAGFHGKPCSKEVLSDLFEQASTKLKKVEVWGEKEGA